ncbi:MAG: C-terminal binding protein [Bryobacterales bacterium]|nr:C-terminal binding protein [Bryobacterales bacterium]
MQQSSAKTVIVTDHGFPSIEAQRQIIESAGFRLQEAKPVCRTEDEIIERCHGADVLLVQWAPVTRRVLQALPSVRCIVRYGVGVNNFDLEAARDLNVVAANVPDYCVEEVSDHTLAMILSLVRKMPQDTAQIRRGEWGVAKYRITGGCSDLTLGLLGFGAIGRRVAEKASAFGFKLIACDPGVDGSIFRQKNVASVDLNRLIETSDILSLHAPLVESTRYVINRDTIARMRPGVLLINTSRGALVNEQDLIEALSGGHVGGAGLDVFEVEPLQPGSPLRTFENVILTSHSASVSEHAVRQLQVKAAEVARDFLMGQRPYSVVN